MLDKNELLKLKEEHSTAKKSIGLFNKEQLDEIVELSEWLQNLITETEKMNKLSSTTDKNMHHMIKLHKKKEKLGKEKHIFEATVSNEMKKKALPIDIGKRMIDIIQLLKSNKIDSIGSKFNYFTELLKSKQVYYTNEETLTKERILIEREVDKSNKLLKDIDTLKSTTININKVNSHKEYLTELEKLEILRTKYIKFLLSLKVVELIKIVKEDSLIVHGFPKKEDKELEILYQFFREEIYFSSMDVDTVCNMFNYSNEKIKHMYPEVSKYKRIVQSNRHWFEQLPNLQNSAFAAFNTNTKSKKFYYDHVPGAKEVLDKMKKYEKNITANKKEDEKNKNYEAEKERLLVYSKSDLEKQLENYTTKLNILSLDEKQNYSNKTLIDQKGILGKLKSIFNI